MGCAEAADRVRRAGQWRVGMAPGVHKPLKDKVLEASDIVDVIGERVSLRRQGPEFVGLCPFHSDHRPSMQVSPRKQIFKCFSCGAGGDVIRFIQMFHRVEFREALSILAERAGIALDRDGGGGRGSEDRERLRQTLAWARTWFIRNLEKSPGGATALAYAHERGLSDETIARFGIGLAPDGWDELLSAGRRSGVSVELLLAAGLVVKNDNGKVYDRFRNRLMFPICDRQGRCVAFGGRTLGDDPAKYLNSPESPLFSKSRVLYALDLARESIARSKRAVVVEGYMDAVLLHQHGFGDVVATLGTALTDLHAKALRPIIDALVLCFDADVAGQKAADRAVEVALGQRIDVRVAVVPAGLDPADMVIGQGPDAFKSLLQSTIAALEFKWIHTEQTFRHEGDRGRQEAIERFLSFIANVRAVGGLSPMDQSVLIGRVAELLSLPAGAVYDWLARARVRAPRRPAGVEAVTDGVGEPSAYDRAVAGLPPGLVAAVEELFGLALSAPACQEEALGSLAAAATYVEPWQRLVNRIRSTLAGGESVSMVAVFGASEDTVGQDLVIRACRRVEGVENAAALCSELCARVSLELKLLREANLHQRTRQRDVEFGDRSHAFESLVSLAARRTGVLGALQQDRLR